MMMPSRRLFWAIGLLMFGLLGGKIASAAVGVYSLSTTAQVNGIGRIINYRLNMAAASGKIELKKVGSVDVAYTILLNTTQLSLGTHSVVWNGADANGKPLASGDYVAVVTVTAARVGSFGKNVIITQGGSGAYTGVACDTNPASPYYGMIYAINAANKRVERYYPDGTSDGYYDCMGSHYLPFSSAVVSRELVSSASPAELHLIGNAGKDYARKEYNGGTSTLIGFGDSPCPQGHTIALVADSSGNTDKWLYVLDEKPSVASEKGMQRFDVHAINNSGDCQRVLSTTLATPHALTLGWMPKTSTTAYIAHFSNSQNTTTGGLRRYTSTNDGASWTLDNSWSSTVDGFVTSVATAPDGTTLYAGLGTSLEKNLIRVNSATGAVINQYSAGSGGFYSVASDAVGNAVLCSGFDPDTGSTAITVFHFPDSGSTDTRTSTAFHYASGAPVISSVSITPSTIASNGLEKATITGVVVDYDGLTNSSHQVTGSVDLSSLGGSASAAFTMTRRSDNITYDFSLGGITAKSGSMAGIHHLTLRFTDSSNVTTTDSTSLALEVTGGAINGAVKYSVTGAIITTGATVQATLNSNSDVVYTTQTAYDGTYSLAVGDGQYTVSAMKDGYSTGVTITTTVANSGTVNGIYPEVRPMTIPEFKSYAAYYSYPRSIEFCLQGICSAQRYDLIASVPGLTNLFFLRDTFNNTIRDGIRVSFTNTVQNAAFSTNYPREGDQLVITGSIGYEESSVLQIQNLTSLRVIGSSTLEAPDQTTIAEFSITPIGEPDPEWGRLQKVSLVTVVDVQDTLAQFQVSDGTHQGWIKVIDGTGVQMPQVGEYLSITGVRDRFSLNGPGCLIPRKSSDIQRNPQNYHSSNGLIKPGWNLISVPADPANPDPLVVFNTVDLLHSSFQFWKNNVDGGGYQSYGSTFGWVGPIERGTAYWLLQNESAGAADFSYDGYTPTQNFQLLIKAHKTAPYWIMFGTPFNSSIDCTKIKFLNTAVNVFNLPWVDAVTSKMIASKAFGFESNTFFEVGPSSYLPQKTDLESWHGYWLLINRPEELTITFPKL